MIKDYFGEYIMMDFDLSDGLSTKKVYIQNDGLLACNPAFQKVSIESCTVLEYEYFGCVNKESFMKNTIAYHQIFQKLD